MRKDVVEELFKKHYNGAMLYVLSLSKNKAVAEDVVSTAFVKALKTADGRVENFKAWLFAVCRNTLFSLNKEKKKYVELNETLADESEHAAEKLIREESYQALYHAIELLPENQKEAVLLFYFEELKVKEIALVTGKTEDYVKVLLFRARENLKKILEKKQ